MSKIGENYSIMEACKGLFGWTRDDNLWQCAEYSKGILQVNNLQFAKQSTPESVINTGLCINGGKIEHITG